MTGYYYVNADWSEIVPEGSPEAAFGVQAKDLKRLGLTPPDGEAVPDGPLPEVMRSANLPEPVESEAPADELEVKEAPKPEDKAVRKPATKARKDT